MYTFSLTFHFPKSALIPIPYLSCLIITAMDLLRETVSQHPITLSLQMTSFSTLLTVLVFLVHSQVMVGMRTKYRDGNTLVSKGSCAF